MIIWSQVPVTIAMWVPVFLELSLTTVVAIDHYNKLDTARDAYVRNADVVIGVIDIVYYITLVGGAYGLVGVSLV